ncbi:Cytochrome b561 and DOMON domain-containing protein [Abeliophyllum distichum]|uniref:Cytochrome b561 and DOMON domain-containing protein n=1 Tax=Abeliophyllum distichum TaxID=126358 RepID=A0ABD1U2K1_9LAMI
MRLFATIVLSEKGKSTVNCVRQVGPSVTCGVPNKHEFQLGYLNSKGNLDLLRGQSTGRTGSDSRTKKMNVLKGVSIDRSTVVLSPSFLPSAYTIGVAGWRTTLKLGSQSNHPLSMGFIQTATLKVLDLSLFNLDYEIASFPRLVQRQFQNRISIPRSERLTS